MGQAKNKRALLEQFFRDHSNCCFCGGVVPATTQDHIPSRCLFRERMWPEGYVFPACATCNSATRDDENLLSLIFRLSIQEPSAVDSDEFRKAMNAVRNNFPGVVEALQLSTREKRRALELFKISRPQGEALSELPMVRFPKVANVALERFMFKLGCALHFRHIGKPLPPNGWVTHEFRTNLMLINQPIPDEIIKMVPAFAKLERCKTELGDQFIYRFGASGELEAGVFLCVFRESFLITLMTVGKPEIFEGEERSERFAKEIVVGGYLSNEAG